MTYKKCEPKVMMEKLVGAWSGLGSGSYPEVGEFEYLENLRFSRSPKGFLSYSQSTTSMMKSPMHQEVGYLRIDEANASLELVIAQPTGVAEILVGRVTQKDKSFRFDLHSDAVLTSPSAKEITRTGRYFRLEGDELSYQLFVEAVGEPYQLHLEASLVRVEGNQAEQ